MASSKFTMDVDDVKRGIALFDERIHNRMVVISQFHAQRAQALMRENAPWTDRTSNARNGLFATPFYTLGSGGPGRDARGRFTSGDSTTYGVVLYHSVPYGIWLETRWAGRLAALLPVLSSEGQEFMLSVAALFSSIAG